MSPGNSEMLVFLPNYAHFSSFLMVAWEKKQKNVSFYGVCMYVRPKLTFVSFYFCFFPNNAHFSSFLIVAWGKKKKQKNVSFYGVCMYVRPKLTFVSFFLFFFAPFPNHK